MNAYFSDNVVKIKKRHLILNETTLFYRLIGKGRETLAHNQVPPATPSYDSPCHREP